jgi:hypothetical protein
MNEYKPNSHRSKEEDQREIVATDKKVEKVVSGTAKARKRNEMQKLADVFISKDVSSVKSYILLDVLIPAMKKAVSDIVTNGIDMLLYGESGGRKGGTAASKVSYRSYYDKQRDRDYGEPSRQRAKTGYSYDDVIFDNRGDAEEVLSRMDELISQFGIVSVADLYDMAGITGNYTDNKYGWTDISAATPVRMKDGYIIRLPRAMPVN